MLPILADLLTYQNDAVLERYRDDFPQANLSAEEAFSELMKYIWLSVKHQHDKNHHPDDVSLAFSCVMHVEMSEIDNMWHTFLLFTRDYHDFCQRYLGGVFFHHVPFEKSDALAMQKHDEEELGRYLSYIYDNLGEKTLATWFLGKD